MLAKSEPGTIRVHFASEEQSKSGLYEQRPDTGQQGRGGHAMTISSRHQILFVEDEQNIQETFGTILQSAGYEVNIAADGIDALSYLKTASPEVLISDLNMPRMSGFEFLSIVRRRFPKIWVIAISGAYEFGDDVPGGLTADAFYPKGQQKIGELLRTIDALLKSPVDEAHRSAAPIWVALYGHSNGELFSVVDCTCCLRAFPVSVVRKDLKRIQESACPFCDTPVRYMIDFSNAAVAAKTQEAATEIASSFASQVLTP